jgi:cyclase
MRTLTAAALTIFLIQTPVLAQDVVVKDISESVKVLTGNGGNVTAIFTGAGIVLVDAGVTAAEAVKMRELIEGVGGEKVKYVVNTHFHGDHTFGNQVFADALIIGHENAPERMKSSKPNVEGFILTLPSLVLGGNATLHLGDRTFEILRFDPGHTDTDLALFVPEEGLLVTGDLVFHNMVPYVAPAHGADIYGWISNMDKLAELGDKVKTVVPGHGEVGGPEILGKQKQFFLDLLDEVKAAFDRGLSLDEAKKEIKMEKYKDYNFFDRLLPVSIEAAWAIVSAKPEK